MAALTRLGALGELDLQIGGVYQVIRGDAETCGCDLLDAAVTLRIVDTVVGFAALAGVGACANRVHGDGERLVGFLRDGTVAHGTGGEALDDFGGRLDFGDVDGLAVVVELHQAAQGHESVRRVVDVVRILLEHLVVATVGRLLEQEDGLGIVQVVLAGTTPLVVAASAQVAVRGCAPLVRVGHAVTDGHFFGDLVKAHATHTGGGVGEVFVDNFLAQAHGFEQLCATVAHDGGDAHLGHDLEHAGGQGLGEVLDGGVRVDLEVAVAGQVFHGFECQVRVHAGGTVGDEQRDMVNLAHVAGLDGHGDLRTGVAAQQVVLHGGGQQQGRNRAPGVVGFTIGQDDEVLAVINGLVDFGEDLVKTLLEGLAAAGDLVQALDHVRTVVAAEDTGPVKPLELGHLIRVDHGQRNQNLLGVQFGIGQQVRFRADGGFKRGDDFLTLPIQRRVGDLRELLGEVVEQHAAAAGQGRHRGVVTHGTERFLTGVGHRGEQQLQILFGVAEGALTALDGLSGVAHVLAAGQVAHLDRVAFHPLAVRVLGGEGLLDLLIGNDAAFGGVD